MGQPAARITDMHACPMATPGLPPIPHVGGPIQGPCSPNVLIGGLLAARVTDMCICVGPPDMIVKGSLGVFINGLQAARIGDQTAHGGVITTGMPTVLIGDIYSGPTGGGGTGTGKAAAATSGAPGGSGTADVGAVVSSASAMEALSPAAQAKTLVDAAKSGAPFCERCAQLAAARGAG